jgi:hypothetical protein
MRQASGVGTWPAREREGWPRSGGRVKQGLAIRAHPHQVLRASIHGAMRTLLLVLAAAPSLGAQSNPAARADSGWMAPLARVHDYEVAIDSSVARSGAASARIRATVGTPSGRLALTQLLRPDSLRGRRARVSAWLSTRDVTAPGAQLVATSYGTVGGLATANTRFAPRTGTSSWREAFVELDMPEGTVAV